MRVKNTEKLLAIQLRSLSSSQKKKQQQTTVEGNKERSQQSKDNLKFLYEMKHIWVKKAAKRSILSVKKKFHNSKLAGSR